MVIGKRDNMSDRIIRATAAGGEIRAFVADTRELVQKAYEHHHTSPVISAALGRTLTIGAIMGVMQKAEDDQLTLMIKGDGPVQGITVTSDSKGYVKGYAVDPTVDIPLKSNGKLDVSGAIGNGQLTVIKDMGLAQPYVGTIELISGEIAEDFTYYFASSEQIPSSVGLGVLVDVDCSIKCAGGFVIQLMPGAKDEAIDKLESNLSSVASMTQMLSEGKTPEDILNILLEGLDPAVLDEVHPEFHCNCSKQRVSDVLASLAKEEIEEMINDGKPIEVHCDFCNTYYEFSLDELKAIKEA